MVFSNWNPVNDFSFSPFLLPSSLSFTHTHTHTLSLSFTHTHTDTHTQTHTHRPTHTHTHTDTHTHTLLSLLDPEKSLKVFWDFFAKCQKYVICKSSNFTMPLNLFPSIRLFLPPFLMMILLLNILEKIHFRLIPFFRFPDDTKKCRFWIVWRSGKIYILKIWIKNTFAGKKYVIMCVQNCDLQWVLYWFILEVPTDLVNDRNRIATTFLQRPPYWGPPVNNKPNFGVPRVVVVHRFDCTPISVITNNALFLKAH